MNRKGKRKRKTKGEVERRQRSLTGYGRRKGTWKRGREVEKEREVVKEDGRKVERRQRS